MKPSSAKAKGRCRRCKEDYIRVDTVSRICPSCKTKCSVCGTPLTDETWDISGKLYRNQYCCKACVAKRCRETRGNKGFCQEDYDLKRLYGLTKEDRDELFKDGCEVCGSFDRLCVDHNHSTGEVRGCLCSRCNTALGMLDDSRTKLLSAERYLRRSEEK